MKMLETFFVRPYLQDLLGTSAQCKLKEADKLQLTRKFGNRSEAPSYIMLRVC